jgi:uncharacterized protein YyaL (SSP411 family)
MWERALCILGAVVASGCTAPAAPAARTAPIETRAGGVVRAGTDEAHDIVRARALGRERLFAWEPWERATFERARREGRFILVHGAAEWCHWCHVMEETTYRDPEVGRLLRDRFVAIRVDVDSRPDIEERYGDWGWPATILLGPDAEELGKLRGYVEAGELLAKLRDLAAAARPAPELDLPSAASAPVAALAWIGANTALRMDYYYDPREGGWGTMQKAPIGDNVLFELARARRGDQAALGRAVFSLEKQAALIDPVWGGIYQYSTGSTWKEPHYEKLMPYQAASLEAYAAAYAATGNPKLLAHARAIERYLATFLSNAEGAFLVSQDADVGAHDRGARFVDGDVYYRLGDGERRALGIPRVDDHVYAEENGLAIRALAALYQATSDEAVLARAERAARLVLARHVDAEGRVAHDAADAASGHGRIFYLDDAASFGLGLARLAEVSHDSDGWAAAATRIAGAIVRDLGDPEHGFHAHTVDPDAHGVFARRRKPYAGNVAAARLFAACARLATSDAERAIWIGRARQTLAAIASPRTLRERGRMVGAFLLALDEAGALDWSLPSGRIPY